MTTEPIATLRRWTDYFDRQLRTLLAEAGHPDLTPAMERLLERIRDDPEATTAQIAAAAQVTQQAVSKLVGALHDAGYLRDVPYPEDRRRRVLALTTRGHDALAAAAKARQQLWKASRTDVQADVLAAVSS